MWPTACALAVSSSAGIKQKADDKQVTLARLPSAGTATADIPYPVALDGAAVHQTQITDLDKEALILGNGDLNALLWEQTNHLCMRVSKNDIWDARVDTRRIPLPKVDVPNQTWAGGGRAASWWKRPYPSPRVAAVVNIGFPAADNGVENRQATLDSESSGDSEPNDHTRFG